MWRLKTEDFAKEKPQQIIDNIYKLVLVAEVYIILQENLLTSIT